MTVVKRAFSNIFWLSLSEVSSKGLIFLGTVYLARVLGKAGFGLFSLSLAVGVYLWTVVDMGVTGYGTREIARNKEKAAELYSLLNSLRLILAVILFIIFCGSLFLTEVPVEKKLILIAGGFYVVGHALLSDWVLRGLEKMQYIALGNVVTALFFLAGIYIVARDSSDTLGASIVYSSSFLVGSVILIFVLKQKLKIPLRIRISFTEWKRHVKESFYFAINASFNNISIFIPIFFMGIWSTAEDLGTFSAPHRLTMLVIRSGALVIMALYPVLSSLYVTNMDDFKKTHAGFQKMIMWCAMPVCVIATVLSKDIVVLIFGTPYAESAGIFSLLIWLSFLMVTRYSFGNALISANFHRFNMFATGAGAAVVTLVSIATVKWYGGYGAAWALISGEVVTMLLMAGLFNKKIGFSEAFKSNIIKIALVSAVMGLIIKILPFPVIATIFISLLGYTGISLIIGIISKRNIRELYHGVVGR